MAASGGEKMVVVVVLLVCMVCICTAVELSQQKHRRFQRETSQQRDVSKRLAVPSFDSRRQRRADTLVDKLGTNIRHSQVQSTDGIRRLTRKAQEPQLMRAKRDITTAETSRSDGFRSRKAGGDSSVRATLRPQRSPLGDRKHSSSDVRGRSGDTEAELMRTKRVKRDVQEQELLRFKGQKRDTESTLQRFKRDRTSNSPGNDVNMEPALQRIKRQKRDTSPDSLNDTLEKLKTEQRELEVRLSEHQHDHLVRQQVRTIKEIEKTLEGQKGNNDDILRKRRSVPSPSGNHISKRTSLKSHAASKSSNNNFVGQQPSMSLRKHADSSGRSSHANTMAGSSSSSHQHSQLPRHSTFPTKSRSSSLSSAHPYHAGEQLQRDLRARQTSESLRSLERSSSRRLRK